MGQRGPVGSGVQQTRSRPKLRSGECPVMPQNGDSVRGWWPQCGKTREWCTTSPVPTHLPGHPTHLVSPIRAYRKTGRSWSIMGESCHKYHFCRDKSFVSTNTCLSRQRFCLDKHVFVATKVSLSRQNVSYE